MSCYKVIILVVHHDSSKDLEIPLTSYILKELTRVLLKHKTNESLPQVYGLLKYISTLSLLILALNKFNIFAKTVGAS